MAKTEYDLCIIGGGAAGLVTAAGAATLGAKVILIEKNRLGGDCLYTGCVPSKTLIHSAAIAYAINTAANVGLDATLHSVDQTSVMRHIAKTIETIELNDSPERFRAMGVEVVFTKAEFIDHKHLMVGDRQITARKFVLATGSRPFIPSILGLNKVNYLTNETIFNTTEHIEHLIILGSGAIGCEMAQSFSRLGVKVSLLSHLKLLPKEDADMSEVIEKQFLADEIRLYLNSRISSIEKSKYDIRVYLNDATVITGTHLLVAAGRQANIENLGLKKAGVDIKNGHLTINKCLRTTNKNIFACGDVAGPYLFTHMAEHQAGIVLRNALFYWPAKAQVKNIPWCTFTAPELARVGLSEKEAQESGLEYRVYSFPFSDVDRAITDAETNGKIKIITSRKGKLLGACIVGKQAGELIAEYVLAISRGLNVSDLSQTIHIYPTLAQINRRVADQRFKESLTSTKKRWIKRLFRLRGNCV
ncbi:MAG: FAD-dependent oxidoreductase [Methylococcales bacterium]|nr:FAD-dependent oxidoreductase [Methylococcales bacterium]